MTATAIPNTTSITMSTIVESSIPRIIPPEISKEAVYAFIPLIGIANAVIMIAYLTNNRLRRVQANKYVFAYAAIDLLVGVVFIPCMISQKEVIRGSMIMYSLLVSLLTLGASTHDRYIAICRPLHYERIQTDQSVNRSIAMCWFLPILVVPLPHIWLRRLPQDFVSLPHRIYLFIVVVSMIMILIIIIVAYVKIFKIGLYHLNHQMPERNTMPWTGRFRQEIKFARLFCSLLLTFIVFWIPTGYMSLVDNVFLREDLMLPDWLSNLNFYWLFMSSLMNPICYAIFHKGIRRTLKSLSTGKKISARVHPVAPPGTKVIRVSTDSGSSVDAVIKVQANFTLFHS